MTQTLIDSIPADADLTIGWQCSINGTIASDIRVLTLQNPAIGCLTYGMTKGGYDGWSFLESGAGGAVILPFVEQPSGLFVGVIEEFRHNLGGVVLNAPRGFLDSGETHLEAARRELAEETGLSTGRIFELPGDPVNCNSAFFETAEPRQGIRFFGLEITQDQLVNDSGSLRFADSTIENDANSRNRRMVEKIGATQFIPWEEAVKLRDMFTVACVARLLAWRSATPPPS